MRRDEIVVQVELRLTVLLPAQSIEEAAATLRRADLRDIGMQISEEGAWLGELQLIGTSRVLPWDLPSICSSYGVDIDFFGMSDG